MAEEEGNGLINGLKGILGGMGVPGFAKRQQPKELLEEPPPMIGAAGRLLGDQPNFRQIPSKVPGNRARKLPGAKPALGDVGGVAGVTDKQPLPIKKKEAPAEKRGGLRGADAPDNDPQYNQDIPRVDRMDEAAFAQQNPGNKDAQALMRGWDRQREARTGASGKQVTDDMLRAVESWAENVYRGGNQNPTEVKTARELHGVYRSMKMHADRANDPNLPEDQRKASAAKLGQLRQVMQSYVHHVTQHHIVRPGYAKFGDNDQLLIRQPDGSFKPMARGNADIEAKQQEMYGFKPAAERFVPPQKGAAMPRNPQQVRQVLGLDENGELPPEQEKPAAVQRRENQQRNAQKDVQGFPGLRPDGREAMPRRPLPKPQNAFDAAKGWFDERGLDLPAQRPPLKPGEDPRVRGGILPPNFQDIRRQKGAELDAQLKQQAERRAANMPPGMEVPDPNKVRDPVLLTPREMEIAGADGKMGNRMPADATPEEIAAVREKLRRANQMNAMPGRVREKPLQPQPPARPRLPGEPPAGQQKAVPAPDNAQQKPAVDNGAEFQGILEQGMKDGRVEIKRNPAGHPVLIIRGKDGVRQFPFDQVQRELPGLKLPEPPPLEAPAPEEGQPARPEPQEQDDRNAEGMTRDAMIEEARRFGDKIWSEETDDKGNRQWWITFPNGVKMSEKEFKLITGRDRVTLKQFSRGDRPIRYSAEQLQAVIRQNAGGAVSAGSMAVMQRFLQDLQQHNPEKLEKMLASNKVPERDGHYKWLDSLGDATKRFLVHLSGQKPDVGGPASGKLNPKIAKLAKSVLTDPMSYRRNLRDLHHALLESSMYGPGSRPVWPDRERLLEVAGKLKAMGRTGELDQYLQCCQSGKPMVDLDEMAAPQPHQPKEEPQEAPCHGCSGGMKEQVQRLQARGIAVN